MAGNHKSRVQGSWNWLGLGLVLFAAPLNFAACDSFLSLPPEQAQAWFLTSLKDGDLDRLQELAFSPRRLGRLRDLDPSWPWLAGRILLGASQDSLGASVFLTEAREGQMPWCALAWADYCRLFETNAQGAGSPPAQEELPSWVQEPVDSPSRTLALEWYRIRLPALAASPDSLVPALEALRLTWPRISQGPGQRALDDRVLDDWLLRTLMVLDSGWLEEASALSGKLRGREEEYRTMLIRLGPVIEWRRRLETLGPGALEEGVATFLPPGWQEDLMPLQGLEALPRSLYRLVQNRQSGDRALRSLVRDRLVDLAGVLNDRGASAPDPEANDDAWPQALAAWCLELAARLEIQSGEGPGALKLLSQALGLAQHPLDLRRVRWYDLRTRLDILERDEDKNRSPDDGILQGFLDLAAKVQGDGWFDDVLGPAHALMVRWGRQAQWEARGLKNPGEWQGWSLFDRMSQAAGRGEALDVGAALAAGIRFQGWTTPLTRQPEDSSAGGGLAAALNQTMDTMIGLGHLAAATALWEDLEALAGLCAPDGNEAPFGGLSVDMACTLIARLQEAGEYRRAHGIAEELRLKLGTPADRRILGLLYPRPWEAEVRQAAWASGVPPPLIWALMGTESGFLPQARSATGARGLCQLMPATAEELMARHGLKGDWLEPGLNISLGALYLAQQYKRLGSWPQALAAYNAGPSRVRTWSTSRWGRHPDSFVRGIPFGETRNYVRRVLESAALYQYLDQNLPVPADWLGPPP